MPGRTDQQCMGRWRRHLDPTIRKCQWQPHEDERLRKEYEAQGPQWSNISKFLQGRTAQQCRARWFQLCPLSSAPPVPRTARNQNGRRSDRYHEGASIQESARQLVAQMSSTGDVPPSNGQAADLCCGPLKKSDSGGTTAGGMEHKDSDGKPFTSSNGLVICDTQFSADLLSGTGVFR
jgi:hypothetical protein